MISKIGAIRMMREKNLDIARTRINNPALGDGSWKDSIANVEILNDSDKKKLKGFLTEAVASLQTIADEREHITDIATRAQKELDIPKKTFRKTAELVQKGTLEETKQLHEDAGDLYDQVNTVV